MGDNCFLAENAVIIGDVILGDDCSIWFGAVLRGDVNPIRIGNRVNIQDNCTLHVTEEHRLKVGSRVTAGHNAILHGCTIGDDVMIGMGAIVLDGAHIGSQSIVAAGSVVPPGKSYPAGSLIMGSPAKHVRDLTQQDLENIKGAARRYVSAKNYFLAKSEQQDR